MSDVMLNLPEDFTLGQTSYVDVLANDLVRTASVIGILKSIGEDYDELIPLLKALTSELVMELSTTSYVEGIADELSGAIARRLWEVEDEFKLSMFVSDVVSLGVMVKEGIKDLEYASEVLGEFIDIFSVDLAKCRVLQHVMSCGDPSLMLQTMLIGLVLAVGGLSHNGG